MDRRDDLIRRIKDMLSIYAVRVDMDKGEASKAAENFYCGLLNILLGYNLQNMNLVRPNFPAIDLGDASEGVRLGVQVTSTTTRRKVQDTLDTFFRHKLEDTYEHLVMLVIGKWTESRKAFQMAGKLRFDPNEDIWDTDWLVRKIEALQDVEHLERIMAHLERNLDLVPEKPAPLNLPLRTAMEAESFVGRETELAQIGERFQTDHIVVLSGLGGMGKTELAVRYGQGYEEGWVYFVNFRKDFFHTVTDEIAPVIPGLTERGLDEDAKYHAALEVLRRLGKGDLLILDNADQAEQSIDQLRRELSILPMRILITTRSDARKAIPVDRLHRTELHRIFEQNGVDISEPDRDELIEAVDGHTLTVDLMARLLRRERRRDALQTLREALRTKDLTNTDLGQIGAAYPGAERQARINEHLRTVFRVSQMTGAEKTVLRFATLLPAGGLDSELFANAAQGSLQPPPKPKEPERKRGFFSLFRRKREKPEEPTIVPKVRDILKDLADRGWLEWKGDLLRIHPVIRIVCREELKPTDENCGAFLDGLRRQIKRDDYDKDTFLQLAELYAGASDDLEDRLGNWALCAGRFWNLLGEARRALDYDLRMVAKREQNQPDSNELATAYNNVGLTYGDLGDHERALEYLLKALAIREKVLPRSHPDLAVSYNNVGGTYGALGDRKRALEYLLKALAIREKVLPRSHPDLARSYNNVGITYGALGDHERALEYLLKALAIREKVLPPTHPDLAQSCNNVGGTYGDLGDHKRALEYQQKALAIFEKVLPRSHPDLALSYNNVGITYGALGDHERALEYGLKALAIWEKVLPRSHPDLAQSYGNLSYTYGELGDGEKELEYDLKAFAIREKVLPPTHPDLALSCNNLAWTYYKMGQYEQALEFMRRAADIAEKSLPEGHPDRVDYRRNAEWLEREVRQRQTAEPTPASS